MLPEHGAIMNCLPCFGMMHLDKYETLKTAVPSIIYNIIIYFTLTLVS